ncbi:hypothetical protein TI39_contig350g00014 [Zymoseptoria brevis]|uniref:Uncharacterized protein n=1 Tax=Zymoseptoria brevis TaxID=1047168 RepID=A0A0F4GUF0_9PEZI|nr:hypothetical protein TI39_contig350g00014 [Zymoseptoria brevis]
MLFILSAIELCLLTLKTTFEQASSHLRAENSMTTAILSTLVWISARLVSSLLLLVAIWAIKDIIHRHPVSLWSRNTIALKGLVEYFTVYNLLITTASFVSKVNDRLLATGSTAEIILVNVFLMLAVAFVAKTTECDCKYFIAWLRELNERIVFCFMILRMHFYHPEVWPSA